MLAFFAMTWAFGWLMARGRETHRPLLRSGLLAVLLFAYALWGWLQEPLFLGSRLLAGAGPLAWLLILRFLPKDAPRNLSRRRSMAFRRL
ncbi:hypothetical protein [Caulobacter endophyticus]|uniref:Uncharacterized protein n=1 Tax=Caulobacter endophyticus TaxID=2172652 RepID=A0A2T9K2X5_9CAUL|nr:hypothetical protein [Caulobacter endophyticus]PVM90336.1 hypothetical protein DDF67_10440 [Caulobacter endophyticus]